MTKASGISGVGSCSHLPDRRDDRTVSMWLNVPVEGDTADQGTMGLGAAKRHPYRLALGTQLWAKLQAPALHHPGRSPPLRPRDLEAQGGCRLGDGPPVGSSTDAQALTNSVAAQSPWTPRGASWLLFMPVSPKSGGVGT